MLGTDIIHQLPIYIFVCVMICKSALFLTAFRLFVAVEISAPQPLKLMRLKPATPGTPNKVFTFRPVTREGGGPAQAVS